MKSQNVVMAAAILFSLVVSRALGGVVPDSSREDSDEDDSSTQDVASPRCPHAVDALSQYDLLHVFVVDQRACLGDPDVVVRRLMTEADTEEKVRAILREVCDLDGAAEFRRCLTNVTEVAERCLDPRDTAFKLFHNVRDYVEAMVVTTCADRGNGVAVFTYEMLSFYGESRTEAERCLTDLEATELTYITKFTEDFSRLLYQAVRGVKVCIADLMDAENKPHASSVVTEFFDGLLGKMTCISSETFEVGLCEDMRMDV